MEDGVPEVDDDLDSFQGGVYLSVYDEIGHPIYGRVPRGFATATEFQIGEMQTVVGENDEWYVYDISYDINGSVVFVRGIASVGGMTSIFNIMKRIMLISLPFLLMVAIVGGFLITNRAFRPVRKITETAKHIGASGDMSQRIQLGEGKDEIYALANTIDNMFDSLEEAFEREKKFTSDASHELRTPISVIISQCEYSIAHAETKEELQNSLETILDKARKMSTLISHLLRLSRTDDGMDRFQVDNVDLGEIATVVAEQMKETADERHITIATDIEPDITVVGDETMLMQLFVNLMENGIKYGREGGRLDVLLKRRGEAVHCEVRDNGIGIAPENLSQIWERFFRVDPARSSNDGSSGLGLPMVRYIVLAHGGHISVESVIGRGSVFTFELPIDHFTAMNSN
jgi:signal transduction histidine kinase